MIKYGFTVCLVLVFIFTQAQSFTEKRFILPEKPGSGRSISKDKMLLSPDGTLLCITREKAPYNTLLLNTATGAIEDSISVEGFVQSIKWSGDSRQLCFHVSGYPFSGFVIFDRKGNLQKNIETPYPVLNYELDNTASEIVAILYNQAETGAEYVSDLTGAYIYPKGKKYTYRIYSFDIAKGLAKDSFSIKATYPRVEGKWKDSWLVMVGQSEAEFKIDAALCIADFKAKQLKPLGNSGNIFANESLLTIKTLPGERLFIAGSRTIFEFSEKENFFKLVWTLPLLQFNGIESIMAGHNEGSARLAFAATGQRWMENELLLYHNEERFSRMDTRDFIPYLVHLGKDSVTAFSFTAEELIARKYAADPRPVSAKPEVLIQNGIEAVSRLLVPNSGFMVEYNSKEWQVTDLSSQLIVHSQRDLDNYGAKFATLGSHPYLVKYTSGKAELIRVGKWKEVAATLSLEDPLLKDGNSVYSGTSSLLYLAFNPATSLLTGLLSSNNYYFAAAWDISTSYSPKYIARVDRKDVPGEKKSLYGSSGAAPILLTHIIYSLQEDEWKNLNTQGLLRKTKQLAGSLSSFTLEKLGDFDDFSWQYEIAAGKIKGKFSYQDSIYGHFLVDLQDPARSVYFCHKPLKGTFPGYKFIPAQLGYGPTESSFSDKTNFLTLSDLGNVMIYDHRVVKNQLIPKENKEANFMGGAHFLVENTGILVSNSAWYNASDMTAVHTKGKTLTCDSASYIPEKKLLLLSSPGRKGYIEIQLDRMMIRLKGNTAEKLQRSFYKDTVFRAFFPAKKNWIIASEDGLGYDTSAKATTNNMGRAFKSALEGRIDFVQLFPARNQVMIGTISEGSFECWDVVNEQLLFKLFVIDENNFFIQGKSGYYYATPNALQQVGFLQDNEAIPASFLDAGLNRPDMVLADLFDTTDSYTRQLVAIYRKAANRKNSRAHITVPGESPVVTVLQPVKTLQQESGYEVKYTLLGRKNAIRSFSIQVNNVLIWDTSFTHPVSSQSLSKKIQLTSGENQLVYFARDVEGHTSVPVFQRIVYQPVKPVESKTYIIAIGVNKYKDTSKNLKYATKDGKDILAAFRSIQGETIITDSLFDEEVTAENIRKLRQKLLGSGVEDKVVLCFSGHGMLDDSMNFYLATHQMDFTQPRKYGFRFNELEELLAGIPARKKLLLIDACHSGNIEKEEEMTSGEKKMMAPEVKAQSDTTRSAKGLDVGKPADVSLQQVISQLFASSSSDSGAEVIAATAGNAYAYESAEWNNGVFTYAVLKAFNNNSDLDKNFNNRISIKELKRFVYATVLDLTNGRQQPLSRYENPNYDWDLLPQRYE